MTKCFERRHFIGSAAELEAMAFYVGCGYQVYAPIIQQDAVDFVLERDGLWRMQVKAGNNNGGYLQCRIRPTNKNQVIKPWEQYDFLVVCRNGFLWEIPSALLTSSNIGLTRPAGVSKPWEKYILRRPEGKDQ